MLTATYNMQLDTELHHLVSVMCDAKAGQNSVHKMTNAAMICRRVAYHHPTLFLRYNVNTALCKG